mgnify:FL=1
MAFKFLQACYGSQPVIYQGIDLWKADWIESHESQILLEPRQGERCLFDIYYKKIGKKKIKFVFQEITNNVYAFFINE